MPARAEAEGRDHVTATFMGCEWRVPLDIDTWPLTAVMNSVGTDRRGEYAVNHLALVEGLEGILADQWDRFVTVAKRRGDLVPASHAFATAVGAGPTPDRDPIGRTWDQVFGAIPRLLSVIATWPSAVESDLNRFWGIDYGDRWRFDKNGRRRLTLRQIHARLSHLPAESALAVQMGRRSPVELLTMDVFEAISGRVHPSRPLTPEQLAERRSAAEKRAKAVAEYERRRQVQGHRGIPAVLENARANAKRGEVSVEEI